MSKPGSAAWNATMQEYYRHLDAGSCARALDAHGVDVGGRRVLDVGCGPGHYLVELSARAPAALVGADVDGARLVFARARLEGRGVRGAALVRADATTLPFASGAFDVILCLLTLPYVPDEEQGIRELARLLRPGGALLLSGHDVGFPLGYLTRWRLKPLLLYPLTLVYSLTGWKVAGNTLQTHRSTIRRLERAGLAVETLTLKRGFLGLVEVFTVKATRPPATQAAAPRAGPAGPP